MLKTSILQRGNDMNGAYLDSLAAYGVGGAHPGGLALTKEILDKESLNPGAAVLDAGCGTGQTACMLFRNYGADVTAMDLHPVMIKKATERLRGMDIEVIQGDVEEVPFKNDSFELVLSESVLAFTNIEESLFNFQHILRENGILLAVEMLKEGEIPSEEEAQLREFYGLPQLLTEEEWKKAIEKAGFSSVEVLGGGQSGDEPIIGNEPEFILSEEITEDTHRVMDRHFSLVEKYREQLGFRVFRCLK